MSNSMAQRVTDAEESERVAVLLRAKKQGSLRNLPFDASTVISRRNERRASRMVQSSVSMNKLNMLLEESQNSEQASRSSGSMPTVTELVSTEAEGDKMRSDMIAVSSRRGNIHRATHIPAGPGNTIMGNRSSLKTQVSEEKKDTVKERKRRASIGTTINRQALEELKKAFDAADADGSHGLEMAEFVRAFGSVLGALSNEELSMQQLTHLFMKIDANSDGSVDWDEFTNFMLLEQQAFSELEPFTEFISRPKQLEDRDVVAKVNAKGYSNISNLLPSKKHSDTHNNDAEIFVPHAEKPKRKGDIVGDIFHSKTTISTQQRNLQNNIRNAVGQAKVKGGFSVLEDSDTEEDAGRSPNQRIRPDTAQGPTHRSGGRSLHQFGAVNETSYDPHSVTSGIHRDSVEALLYLPKGDRYLLGSRDGHFSLWDASNAEATWLKTYVNGDGAWISAAAHMPLSNRVALCSVDRSIHFYDDQSFELVSRITDTKSLPMQYAPLAVDAAVLGGGTTGAVTTPWELLSVGDDGGNISLFYMNQPDWHICEGRQGSQGLVLAGPGGPTVTNALPCEHRGGDCVTQHVEMLFWPQIHTDWVTKVQYSADLGCLITCSLDNTVKFLDIERHVRAPVKRTFSGHSKGVYSFGFCPTYKFMASCGVERQVLISDPYTCKVINSLNGHTASVQKLSIQEEKNLMITLSLDKTIKVWDVRTFKCMQTLPTGNFTGGQRMSCLMFDSRHNRMVTATDRLQLWAVKPPPYTGTRTHHNPLCSVLFNKNFNQVVTADIGGSAFDVGAGKNPDADPATNADSTNPATDHTDSEAEGCVVRVWDTDSGQNVFSFHAGCRVTCACFDYNGRRLIAGTHDGQLKMYNFSNGACLTTFVDDVDELATGEDSEDVGASQQSTVAFDSSDLDDTSSSGLGLMVPQSPRVRSLSPRHRETEQERKQRLGLAVSAAAMRAGRMERAHRSVLEDREVTCVQFIQCVGDGENEKHGPSRRTIIVSVGWDKKVKVWPVDADRPVVTPEYVLPLEGDQSHQYDILSLAVCDTALATGDCSGAIILWHVESGRYIAHLAPSRPLDCIEAGESAVERLVYVRSKRVLISAGADGLLRFWDVTALKQLAEFNPGFPRYGARACSLAHRVVHLVEQTDRSLAQRIVRYLNELAKTIPEAKSAGKIRPNGPSVPPVVPEASQKVQDFLRALAARETLCKASISALELSQAFNISLTLATQQLLTAEQFEYLARDSTVHGLRFHVNIFLLYP